MKFMILMQNVVLEDLDSAYISVSNSFDPDQAGHIVGFDLGPNCLKRLSADGTTRRQRNKACLIWKFV